MAPFSRIQATATEVSRPPEKAMPTRSPTGREVRTLLTVVPSFVRLRGGVGVVVGQRRGSVGPSASPPVGVAADHQHGVVAGDGAEDVGQLGLVERGGEELRGARRGPQDDQVGAGLGADEQLVAQPGQPVRRPRRSPPARRVAVAALAGYGVDERAGRRRAP